MRSWADTVGAHRKQGPLPLMYRRRVALCFFGLPRALPQTSESIRENLIAPLAAQADLVCLSHLYDGSAEPGEEVTYDTQSLLHTDHHEQEPPGLCLSQWGFDGLLAYGDYWQNGGVSLRNLVHQLHSLHRVTQMAQKAGAEHCLFVRPDLLYHDSLERSVSDLLRCDADRVFLPDWQHWKGGLNDRMAYCAGPKAIEAYGKRADIMHRFCKATRSPLQSEQLVAYALWQAGLPWSRLAMRASRIRANGAQVSEDFTPRRARRLTQKLKLRTKWMLSGNWPGR